MDDKIDAQIREILRPIEQAGDAATRTIGHLGDTVIQAISGILDIAGDPWTPDSVAGRLDALAVDLTDRAQAAGAVLDEHKPDV